jgi:hypothetical protein
VTPTQLLVLRPNGLAEIIELGPDEASSYSTLKPRLQALIGEPDLEHVTVWHEHRKRDMFVAEGGDLYPLNPSATSIYRASTMRREPRTNPQSLPEIHGTAVLCGQIVWR